MLNYAFFVSPPYKWVHSVATGLFLYIFLIAFLPFGVSNYNPNHQYTTGFLLEIAIFGLFTIGISLFNEFVFKQLLPSVIQVSTILTWWIWSVIFIGSSLFIVYNYLGEWHDWKWMSAVRFIFEVSMVFIFPFIGVFFFFNYRNLQHQFNNVLISREPENTEMLQLSGQGNRENLTLPSHDFLFARAQDNYVELNYMINGKREKSLFRTTLSSLERTSDSMIRCHRSYLVNVLAVNSIHGGKNDLTLRIAKCEEAVPVSRTYTSGVIDLLKKYKLFSDSPQIG